MSRKKVSAHSIISKKFSRQLLFSKILNKICDLRMFCGEIFLENGIGFHEISYQVITIMTRGSGLQPRIWLLSMGGASWCLYFMASEVPPPIGEGGGMTANWSQFG
ncbi:MAG: hypothetical protein GY850_07460 [bacterium]|nr:hypothetical protein [bacterium]